MQISCLMDGCSLDGRGSQIGWRFAWKKLAHRTFEHLIYSCDYGSIKPELVIYRSCLELLKAAPQHILESKANSTPGPELWPLSPI